MTDAPKPHGLKGRRQTPEHRAKIGDANRRAWQTRSRVMPDAQRAAIQAATKAAYKARRATLVPCPVRPSCPGAICELCGGERTVTYARAWGYTHRRTAHA